jgi:predicted Fe-S protein YdhL (DUF1289 family)
MPVESPCNKICTLDQRVGICIGCGRTLDEIARWSAMDDTQRAQVMNLLGERLTTLKQKL